mmetsp:Transcript_10954/g.15673  ORF Transcript_10954/g.15673 Transcript_10954/m.15673 type:complete len:185 (+) Transcript_10954:45-599(+)
MSTEEPPAKKMKPTGWEDYTMNISEAVMKADEGRFLTELANEDVRVIQGVGPKADAVLEALKVKSVKDLATYKYFLLARSLLTLSEVEVEGDRPTASGMNVDKAVDKEFENKSLKEICAAPTSALEGLSEKAGELLSDLGVKTIADLATFKYCRWAEAICSVAEYEEPLNAQERKMAAALKKLT